MIVKTFLLCHEACINDVQLQFLANMYMSGNCKGRSCIQGQSFYLALMLYI